MIRQLFDRYSNLFYFTIFLVAVLLAVGVFNYMIETQDRLTEFASFLLSLSTELLGTVLVFFLVNRYFMQDDWDLSQQVKTLVEKLQQQKPSTDNFFENKLPPMDELVKKSDHIDLCGVTLTSTINKQLGNLRNSLMEGAHVRILLINRSAQALNNAAFRAEYEGDQSVDYFRKKHEATINDLIYLHNKLESIEGNKGKLEVKLLSYAPSFGLFSFDCQKPDGTIMVEFYPHHGSFETTPVITLKNRLDSIWFAYYQKQFEDMWQHASAWNPRTDSKQLGDKHFYNNVKAESFLSKKYPNISSSLSNARDIVLFSKTSETNLSNFSLPISNALANGAKVTLIISTKNALEKFSPSDIPRREEAIKRINWLNNNPKNKTNIKLWECDFLPQNMLLGTDLENDDGQIIVRIGVDSDLYSYRPKFVVLKSRDLHWYTYFKGQIDFAIEKSALIPLETQSSNKRSQSE